MLRKDKEQYRRHPRDITDHRGQHFCGRLPPPLSPPPPPLLPPSARAAITAGGEENADNGERGVASARRRRVTPAESTLLVVRQSVIEEKAAESGAYTPAAPQKRGTRRWTFNVKNLSPNGSEKDFISVNQLCALSTTDRIYPDHLSIHRRKRKFRQFHTNNANRHQRRPGVKAGTLKSPKTSLSTADLLSRAAGSLDRSSSNRQKHNAELSLSTFTQLLEAKQPPDLCHRLATSLVDDEQSSLAFISQLPRLQKRRRQTSNAGTSLSASASSLIWWNLSAKRVASGNFSSCHHSSYSDYFHFLSAPSSHGRTRRNVSIQLFSTLLYILLPPVALFLYLASQIHTTTTSAAKTTTNKARQQQQQQKRQLVVTVLSNRLQYIFLLHFFSFLMCCYASSSISFTQSLGRVATTSTSQTTFNAVNTGEQTSLAEPNPFSRHQRHTFTSDKVCHVWNSHSAEALCGKGRWARLRLMREILLFSRDCDEPSANIYLGELFRLDWRVIRTETDLIALTEQLRPGVEGRDCVLSPLHSPKCHTCFERIDTAMTQLNAAYMAFEHTLRRFDCLLAVDSSSATRPFSPNGTCLDCKIWYRKWLLVELVRVWQQPPCINWCFYTQLACPHFGTSKVVDFAGHPAFMCRDLNIPQISTGSSSNGDYIPDEDGIRTCNCVHPCDLQRDFQSSADMQQYFATALERQAEKEAANHPYDFYASVEHCWARRKRCRAQLVQPLVDGVSPSTSDRFNGANALVVPTTRVKKNGNAIN